jgi:predicted dithiol-disulfide oxidoreductase (DUF899 family)
MASETLEPVVHLNQRDVTMACVSRVPLEKINAWRDEDNIPAGQWWWRRHDEYEDG